MSYSCPNEWKKVNLAARWDMALRADSAVVRSFILAQRHLKQQDPSEPDLVRSFFVHGLQDMEDEWNAVLSAFQLRLTISGVFAHQTPKVKPILSDKRRRIALSRPGMVQPRTAICELGDLLFIVMHEGSTTGCGNAMLLQAKKGFGPGSDSLQRLLYEHSLQFEYKKSRLELNGKKRSLAPKEDTKLAYWDITPPTLTPPFWQGTKIVFAADARMDTFGGQSFGDALTQIVFGHAGTGFSLANADNGWGGIVGDLVSVTAKRILTNSPINVRGAPRGRKTDQLAKHLVNAGGSILVRNSLGEALRLLSADFSDAADALKKSESLAALLKRLGSKSPPTEPPEDVADRRRGPDEGITTVFVKCGNLD
jgi:hypothetical protein